MTTIGNLIFQGFLHLVTPRDHLLHVFDCFSIRDKLVQRTSMEGDLARASAVTNIYIGEIRGLFE